MPDRLRDGPGDLCVVQGYVGADKEALTAVDLHAGESAVEVPARLLRDLLAGLRR